MNQKLKVIQIIDSLNPGGAEIIAVNIANGLAEKGIKSYLCATRLEGDLVKKIKDEVGYLFLDKKSLIDIKAFIKLKKFIQKNQISIIHAHSSSYFIAVFIKLVYPEIKIVWHDHYGNSENLKDRNIFPLKIMSNFFNVVISVNKLLENWALHNLRVKKVYTLSNFASFNSDIQKITFLKGEENKRIICLANLREQKDHINLLSAFSNVHKYNPDWTLHLVGLDLMDDYSDRIKLFISEKKLTNSVFLYGSCQDVQFILSQANIGVLSSKSEGLPIALLEYGMAKLPVIVTSVGGCSGLVDNLINGFVVPPSSSIKLAEKLITLIKSKNLQHNFGYSLYNKIQNDYSKNKYIQQLKTIYQISE